MDQQKPVQESPDGEMQGEQEETFSAGEAGEAGAADGVTGGLSRTEVVIGEIPAADEPTTMLWTARCSEPTHDLLGHFGTRDEAETTRTEHLRTAHGGGST
jgi:hypothetical protein